MNTLSQLVYTKTVNNSTFFVAGKWGRFLRCLGRISSGVGEYVVVSEPEAVELSPFCQMLF